MSLPSRRRTAASGPPTRQAASSAVADAAAVVFFAAVGRSSHAEGVDLAGVASTAWPFLAGAALGWALVRGWRDPTALRTGAVVWVCAVAVGVGLRAALGQGAAPSFVVVTAVVLGALLVGRRAVVAAVARRRARAGALA